MSLWLAPFLGRPRSVGAHINWFALGDTSGLLHVGPIKELSGIHRGNQGEREGKDAHLFFRPCKDQVGGLPSHTRRSFRGRNLVEGHGVGRGMGAAVGDAHEHTADPE